MFKLTIVFGPGPTVWPLLFRTEEKAKAAALKIDSASGDRFILADDFSQSVCIKPSSIHGSMLEDLEASKLAHVEHQMHVWHVQAQSQQRAMGDPVLRASAARQGPAVITPQGNGGFPGARF